MASEIYGNGPAAAYLAALAASAGRPVTWVTTGRGESLRPALIRGPLVTRLRRFLARNGANVNFLVEAPEHEGWRVPESNLAHRFRFRFFEEDSDRWVREEDLLKALSEVALRRGASVRSQPTFPIPATDEGHRVFVEARDSELPHWPLRAASTQERWATSEIYFARGGSHEFGSTAQVAVLEACYANLVPHPDGGSVLSLASRSRYPIERALAALASMKGRGPREWRTLWLGNPGAARRDDTRWCGPSSQKPAPGLYLFGDSIGVQAPVAPWLLSESLDQAERLFDEAFEEGCEAELWFERESARYRSIARRLSVWERCLGSDRFQEDFLAVASFLPPSFRELLKTPL